MLGIETMPELIYLAGAAALLFMVAVILWDPP